MPARLSVDRISLFIVEALAYTTGRAMPRLRCAVHQAGTWDGVAAPDSTSIASALLPNSEIDRCCAFGNLETM
jgi:hypothetical protein